MKRTVLMAIAFAKIFTISAAQAESPSLYHCSNVGGTAEWTVSFDLKRGMAGFFDNDSTVKMKLKATRLLETMPPQMVYYYEGKDGKALIRAIFNYTRKTGTVILNAGAPNQESLQSLDGCQAAK